MRACLPSAAQTRGRSVTPHLPCPSLHSTPPFLVHSIVLERMTVGAPAASAAASTASAAPLGSEFTLLDYACAVWMILITLVILSPLFKLLTEAGTYGKLLASAAPSASASSAKASAQRSGLSRLFLHPSLYISTRTAFISYYAVASCWNGWLLFEADIVWNSQGRLTFLYRGLRSIAGMISPAQARQFEDHPRIDSEREMFQLSLVLLHLFLFELHLLRRLWESLAVSVFSPASRQHSLVTLLALVYYFLASFTPVVDSPLLGNAQSGFASDRKQAGYPLLQIGATLVFGLACWAQYAHHSILADLRRKPSAPASSSASSAAAAAAGAEDGDIKKLQSRYSIPRGLLFRFVSMPHYLCEISEYTALWIVGGAKFSGALVVLWVAANLTITALRSHRWYRSSFSAYPKERKAIIPFVL